MAPDPEFTRRRVLEGAGGLGLAAAAGDALALTPATPRKEAPPVADAARLTLHVNGTAREVEAGPETTLLDALRDRLGLVGTKKGCDLGHCGACTVHLDGRRVNACLVLLHRVDGREVTTIEGLAASKGFTGEALHPVQQAFIDHDAFQCGYCTPGQIMAAASLIEEGRGHDEAEIRAHLSGNLCRCGAHANIIAAVQDAAARTGARP